MAEDIRIRWVLLRDYVKMGWLRYSHGLFFQDTFEPVTDKCANDEDDHKNDDLDKYSKHTKETDTDADTFRNKERREKDKNNTQNETNDGSIPQDAQKVFFPMVKKAKCYPDNEIQQFKPHINTPDLKQNIGLPLLNRFRKSCRFPVPENAAEFFFSAVIIRE
jgi:hypothetical protein